MLQRHQDCRVLLRYPHIAAVFIPRVHGSARRNDADNTNRVALVSAAPRSTSGFPLTTQVASFHSRAGHFRPSRARANRPKSRDKRWGSPRRISSRRWTSRPSSASTWCVRRPAAPTGHRHRLPRFPSREISPPHLREPPRVPGLTLTSLALASDPPPLSSGDGQGMGQRRQARVQRRRRAALPVRRRRAADRHDPLQAARQPHVPHHPRPRGRDRAEDGQGVREQAQPLVRQLR